jgi:hypothetical protein
MKIKYTEADLDDVTRYFAENYTFTNGELLVSYEAFVDTAKHKVVFKLTTTDPSTDR